MEVNVGSTERIVRGILGVVLLGAGLAFGRLTWWGILLDVVGALLAPQRCDQLLSRQEEARCVQHHKEELSFCRDSRSTCPARYCPT